MPRARPHIRRLDSIDVEIVTRGGGEGYALERIHKPVFVCMDCAQVWPLEHLAFNCRTRGHASEFEQSYQAPGGPYDWDHTETITHTYRAMSYSQYLEERGQ